MRWFDIIVLQIDTKNLRMKIRMYYFQLSATGTDQVYEFLNCNSSILFFDIWHWLLKTCKKIVEQFWIYTIISQDIFLTYYEEKGLLASMVKNASYPSNELYQHYCFPVSSKSWCGGVLADISYWWGWNMGTYFFTLKNFYHWKSMLCVFCWKCTNSSSLFFANR